MTTIMLSLLAAFEKERDSSCEAAKEKETTPTSKPEVKFSTSLAGPGDNQIINSLIHAPDVANGTLTSVQRGE